MSETKAATPSDATIPTVAGLLGPPVIWAAHFAFVYGFQSVACSPGGRSLPMSTGIVAPAIALATVAAVVGIVAVWLGLRAHWRRAADRPSSEALACRAVGLLSLLAAFGVLAAGVAAVFLTACAALV